MTFFPSDTDTYWRIDPNWDSTQALTVFFVMSLVPLHWLNRFAESDDQVAYLPTRGDYKLPYATRRDITSVGSYATSTSIIQASAWLDCLIRFLKRVVRHGEGRHCLQGRSYGWFVNLKGQSCNSLEERTVTDSRACLQLYGLMVDL